MAQPAVSSGRKNPLGITGFWPLKCIEPPVLWEFWNNRFQWGINAKYSINPKNYYFAATLTETQITALPGEVDGKNRFQFLARKQQIKESLEQFHSVLSGLAARCNFGALEDRILRDVFIVNRNIREAQNELCRSTKTPEELYRVALLYERGDKYAKSNVAISAG